MGSMARFPPGAGVGGDSRPANDNAQISDVVSSTPYALHMATEKAKSVLAALEEDLRTAWAPDALGHVDALNLVEFALDTGLDESIGTVERMTVPKPDGSVLTAPILGLTTSTWLHEAVEPLKKLADSMLSPGVCGYRNGAEAGLSYSDEHRRFQQFTTAEAEGSGFVIFADVAKFFSGSSWDLVLSSVEGLLDDKVPVESLQRFARSADRSGLHHLPAGYADARFLSNIVLAKADESVPSSFARWVDDYRIFVRTESEAEAVISSLETALQSVGLGLNSAKMRVLPASLFPTTKGAALESVYHPDVDPSATVRTSLRSVFLEAAADPVAHRRSIRFALPRLAEQGDDIAVDWALAVLPQIPWEAPRICAYLAAFADSRISAVVEGHLIDALSTKSVWTATRLAALVSRSGLSNDGARTIAAAIKSVHSPALWSLLIRALSLSGHSTEVRDVIDWDVVDPRGALGALRDIDSDSSSLNQTILIPTREALKPGPAPAPVVDSIL